MKERITVALRLGICVVAWAGCATFSSGCGVLKSGLGKAGDKLTAAKLSPISSSSASALSAFQTGFYAFAVKNCAQCHGSNQVPLFAVADVNSAYANAKPYANFASPSSSALVQFAGNGHCGLSNCSGSGQASLAESGVSAWALAENSVDTGGGGSGSSGSQSSGDSGNDSGLVAPSDDISWLSAPLSIPANLPNASSNKFSIMRWNLSKITPANTWVTGDIFEIQIQYLTSTTYRLSSPKLIAGTNAIRVSGIHVLIRKSTDSGNGKEYPIGNAWGDISADITPSAIPSPLPATPLAATPLTTDTVPLPVLSTSDMITIGFERLAP